MSARATEPHAADILDVFNSHVAAIWVSNSPITATNAVTVAPIASAIRIPPLLDRSAPGNSTVVLAGSSRWMNQPPFSAS